MEKGVRQEEYDAEWIASAWGSERSAELLRPGPIRSRPRIARAIELLRLEPGLIFVNGWGCAASYTIDVGGCEVSGISVVD